MPTDELVNRVEADARWLDEQTRPIALADVEQRRVVSVPLRKPTRRVPAKAIAALTAAAVSFAAIGLWAATRPGTRGDEQHVRIGGITPVEPPGSAHVDPRSGAPLYLEPSYLPAGFALVRAEGGNDPNGMQKAGDPNVTRTQQWVRFNPSHTAAQAMLAIQWGKENTARSGTPSKNLLAGYGPGAVPIAVRGTSGVYSKRVSAVAWIEPAGQEVSVSCGQCTRAELVSIANGLQRRPDDGFEWPAPNAGFVLINEAPGMASSGANLREVTYRDGHGRGIALTIVDDTQEPPLSQLGFPGAHLVDLRGTQAVVATQLNQPGVQTDTSLAMPSRFVTWLEYPNVAVEIGGTNMSETELVEVANGLRPVDGARWARLGGSPLVDASTTTPPDPATRAAIEHAFEAWLDGAHPQDAAPFIEDDARIQPAIDAAHAAAGNQPDYHGRVDSIAMFDHSSAQVTYSVLQGTAVVTTKTGFAVRQGSAWKVSRETICAVIAPAAKCPPK